MEEIKQEAVLNPIIDPQTDAVLEQRIAIPYTETEPTFNPRVNGVRRIYYDGSDYWLYIYANGAWRSQLLGSGTSRSFKLGPYWVDIATSETSITSLTATKGSSPMVISAHGMMSDSGSTGNYTANYLNLYCDSTKLESYKFTSKPASLEERFASVQVVLDDILPVHGTFTDITTKRQGGADVQTNSDLYVIGGYTSFPTTTTAVERYNFASPGWSTKAVYPASLAHATCQFDETTNKIYCFGGKNSAGTAVSNTYIYDISGNSWSAGTAMPTARSHAASFLIGRYIYVVAGWDGSAALSVNERYSIDSPGWTTMTACDQAALDFQKMAVYQEKGYMIGGTNSGHTINYNNVQIYNPANEGSDPWTAGTAMPNKSDSLACQAYGDKIYCFGGPADLGGDSSYDDTFNVYEYNITTDSWRRMPPMNYYRENANIALVGDKFYITGGRIDIATGETYQITDSTGSHTFTVKADAESASQKLKARNFVLIVE